MKTKTKFLSSFFFLTIFISGLFLIPNVFSSGIGVVALSDNDTYVHSVVPDTNYGDSSTIHCGYNNGYRRSLIDFNITDALEQYSLGVVSDYIYIRLHIGWFLNDPIVDLETWVYEITESWDENITTWNNKPSYDSVNVSYRVVPQEWMYTTYGYIYLDITDSFLDVLNDEGVDFYGYYIFGSPVSGNTQYMRIHTKEYGSESGQPSIFYSNVDLLAGEEEEEGIIGGVSGDFLANWFIYAIFFVVIPIAMVATISNMGDNVSPSLMLTAFMASETIMTAISVSINLVGIWFMLIVIITDIMIIFSLMKGRG